MKKTLQYTLLFLACMFRACMSVMAQTQDTSTVLPAGSTAFTESDRWQTFNGKTLVWGYNSAKGTYYLKATTQWVKANYSTLSQLNLKQPRILPSFLPTSGVVTTGDSIQRALEKLQFQATNNVSSQIQIQSGVSGFSGDGKTYTNTSLAGKNYTLFQNGIGRYLLASEYTITSTGGFVLTNPLLNGDMVLLTTTGLIGVVSPPSAGTQIIRETPIGLINGSNTSFTIAHIAISGTETFFRNGVLQDNGSDYTITGATITTVFIPQTGDKLKINYRY